MNPQWFFWSKKIHRFLIILSVILGIIMMITGASMKYFIGDVFLARQVHNVVSTYFAIVFMLQAATGLVLYLWPWLMKRKS